ncbi:MAG: choice-of-anchor D domain-containing protein [bacterium]
MLRSFGFGWILFVCVLAVGGVWHSSYADAVGSEVDTVTVRIPNVWAMPGDTIAVPVFADDVTNLDVYSVQFKLIHDHTVLSLAGDTISIEGTIVEPLIENGDWWEPVRGIIGEDTLVVVMVGVTAPLSGEGALLFVTFRVPSAGSVGQTSPIELSRFLFNEGSPAARSVDGTFTVGYPPRIELSETAHDFGTVDVGQSAEWTLRISNVGDNLLEIYALQSDTTQFVVLSSSFPQSIAAGETMDAVVTFKPDSGDTVEGSLWLSCNDLDSPVLYIPLSGVGGGTRVQLSSFSAHWQGRDVILQWRTSDESDHLGFYLYRSRFPDRGYQRISSGLITGRSPYVFLDKAATEEGTYYYRLNSVDWGGYEETVGFTSVKVSHSVPETYSLSQNYPNPFNPETEISYQLPVVSGQTSHNVTLKIYSILGQEIRTLVDEVKEAGYYSATWDGRDYQGEDVSSGVYFYRLRAGDFVETKRMVLIR